MTFKRGEWVEIGKFWLNTRTGQMMPVIRGAALPATDTFTTTGDQDLTAYSANWTNNTGGFRVLDASDDVHSNSVGVETAAHWNADSFNDNQYGQITITAITGGGDIGVAVRCAASANTYYGYYGNSTTSYLFSVKAGEWAQLGSNGGGFNVNDVIRLEVNGNTLTPKINGSTTGTPGAQVDSSSPITSGYAGICGYSNISGIRGDNWEGGNLGAETNITATQNNQAQVSDAATLGVITPLAIADNNQVQVSDLAILAPITIDLIAAEDNQAQISDAVTFDSLIYPIIAAECNQGQASDAASVSVQGATRWTTYWTTQFDQDQEAWVTLAHIAGIFRLWGRMVNPEGGGVNLRGYYAKYESGTVSAYRYNDATTTDEQLGTASVTLADGDKIWLRLEGAQVQVYTYQSGAWSKQIDVTDSSPALEGGYIGFDVTDASAILDDFGGGNLTVSLAAAENNQAQVSDAAILSAEAISLTAAEDNQDQASDTAILGVITPIAPSEQNQAQVSDTVAFSTSIETFETEAGWIVETDTSGTGSTVVRSNEQAYAGTYSAKCFTTNTSAKAQVRDVISSPWSGVPSADPGEFIWQHAYIYVPTATSSALTGAEYLDLAGFYVSGDASGWYLRLGASAGLSVVGPGSGGQAAFNIYKTMPLDQWVELEIGLWSQNIEAGKRSFIVFLDGDCYGWYRLGVSGTDYDRAAMGIVATNSADDLAVYVDNWRLATSGADPTGIDNRLTAPHSTIDFTAQSGKDIDIQYQTWEEAGVAWQDATRGIGGFRSQAGPNSDKQRANLESGWAEIVIDWAGGVEPVWPPDETWGTYFFAAMVAFRKYFPDEENLEIVILYNYASSGTAELAYEAWVTGQTVYQVWELPEAAAESGAHFPEPGDKIRVRWEELGSNLIVNVDYYDASADVWYYDCITDTRNLTNVDGVNFLDSNHVSVSATTETTKYSVRSIEYGTLATFTEDITAAENNQGQVSDAAILSLAITSLSVVDNNQAQTSDAATIVAIYPFIAGENNQAQISDEAIITSGEVAITASQQNQAQVSDAATLTAIYPFTAAENNQAQVSDAASITFSGGGAEYNITVGEDWQAQTSDAAALGVYTPITVSQQNQAQASDAANITASGPIYSISAADNWQAQAVDIPGLGVVYVIAAAEDHQAQVSDLAVLSLTGVFEHGERRLYQFEARGSSVFDARGTSVFAKRADLEVND